STWKGMSRRLRLARNRAMSSPSTRSSVSSSRRWTPAPRRTKLTSFSPATMPRPMRIASLARCVVRGSAAIRTSTGASAATWGRSVQRDEAIGAVDEIGQHHEAAVADSLVLGERDAALLAAIGAHEEPRAPRGERLHAWIVEEADALVDQVEVQICAGVQGGFRQADGVGVIAVLGAGGHE